MCKEATTRRPVEKLKKSLYPSWVIPPFVGLENWAAIGLFVTVLCVAFVLDDGKNATEILLSALQAASSH